MRTHLVRTLELTATVLLLAASAQAQGNSQGKGKAHNEHPATAKGADARRSGHDVIRGGNRDVIRGDNRDVIRGGNRDVTRGGNRDVYGNRASVPPGLAKKPGQMPPGQYKKRYGTYEGADVLGGILRRRGYPVLRVVPAGESQYVYYRMRDGSQRRATVSPGTDRLVFRNVPTSLLQEVLAKLY